MKKLRFNVYCRLLQITTAPETRCAHRRISLLCKLWATASSASQSALLMELMKLLRRMATVTCPTRMVR